MRPEVLNPLFAPIDSLPGVGPRLKPAFVRLTGETVRDLLWHLPHGVVDRRLSPALTDAVPGTVVTVEVKVESHHSPAPNSPRSPWRVKVADDTASLDLVFFRASRKWITETLPVGRQVVVSGRVDVYQGRAQMTHPDHIVAPDQADSVRRIEPIYGLGGGITPKVLGKALAGALKRCPELPEWLDPTSRERLGWPAWEAAVRAVHAPVVPEDLEPTTPARQRLAYDELLANQLALMLVRRNLRRRAGRALAGGDAAVDKVLAALPFPLTSAQQRVGAEIAADMASPERMLRLLQGDVGSGKTVVAFLALVRAVACGTQGALMAPTEILARQHLATLEPLAKAAGVRLGLLTGRATAADREATLAALAAGDIDIILGTHALFQPGVTFRDLGLAVIDEQHRFGVHQRVQLSAKGTAASGHHPDVLVMTATPIPRTLTLTAYGDMDVSRLDEKPPGRQKVDTRIIGARRLGEVVAAIGRAVNRGDKVYWVCPAIDGDGLSGTAAVEQRAADLKARSGLRVGLVHGQMKGEDKDRVMADFAGDGLDVLVATTVIEVGVNVPTATVMVVEQAERFGLAQLHQLRGRVGRGKRAATCLLVYGDSLTDSGRVRLETLRRSDDGFEIAETDLALRGGGEVLGTRQSGLPAFRLADLGRDTALLDQARREASYLVEVDPQLEGPRGKALRVLLYLFDRDSATRTLRGG
ncbi:ATP-dependent DNA helicase RecG [Roseospirillum parvum]|uniref:Probable DNA 3'-5' helicase RecG n=1 Tax=Roseospirillum parvum TaxID=83401 RepID=A0A1G7XVZ2_9PROT|nr:ATP-dependent DNA helicase RecG [Roseospirillum parvum]SDG88375.1 ATP-dependent DNA helicase RecG [Roseospirillum parvum]